MANGVATKKNIEEDRSTFSTYRSSSVANGVATEEDKIAPELWQKVKDKVQGQIAKGNYETWIKETRGLRFSDSTLVVGAPSSFVQEHIERFLYSHLLKSTIEVLERKVKLEFQTS